MKPGSQSGTYIWLVLIHSRARDKGPVSEKENTNQKNAD